MKTEITEAEITFYRTNGYHVLRQIIPVALITDLRRVAAQALTIARRLDGPQAQRLAALDRQPELDCGPVKTFAELPELNAAVQALLTPRHRLTAPLGAALLFEPAERCWATEWHRDWRDHMNPSQFAGVFEGQWERLAMDADLFNQINCALYEDPATWYVPGSHHRLRDTAEEIRAAKAADRAAVENKDRGRTEAEQERFLHDYCAAMPGAVQLHLQPGDLAIYRSVGWHIGNYVPYRRRATLHCSAMTPAYGQFQQRAAAALAK